MKDMITNYKYGCDLISKRIDELNFQLHSINEINQKTNVVNELNTRIKLLKTEKKEALDIISLLEEYERKVIAHV